MGSGALVQESPYRGEGKSEEEEPLDKGRMSVSSGLQRKRGVC